MCTRHEGLNSDSNKYLHLHGVCLLVGKRDHKQVVCLVCQMVIDGMEINKAGSRISGTTSEGGIVVLSRVAKKGLRGDIKAGERNEGSGHVDS